MSEMGELKVRISADASQLNSELQSATQSTKQSADAMSGAFGGLKDQLLGLVPAVSAVAFLDFAKGALEAANNLYIMGQRTGIAAETLSKLNIPLLQNGSSVDEFSNSMKFLSRNIELAAEGNPMLIKAFDDLGLSVTRLKALTPEEQFYAVADAMSKVTDQSKFNADGMAVMGRGFISIAPLIKAAAGNMHDFVNAMDGLTPTEINKVHQYDDAWTSFWEHMKIGAVEATVAVHDFLLQGIPGYGANNPNVSTTRPAGVMDLGPHDPAAVAWASQHQNDTTDKSAKGNNSDIKSSTPQATATLQPYIDKLKEESDAAEESTKALIVRRAEIEADAKAQADFTAGLRDSQKITDDEKASVDQAAGTLYDHKEALAQNKQVADQLTNSLTKIIMNFKDMKSAITDLFESIAQEIIKTQISNPLATSISSSLPSFSGIFSGFSSIFSGLPGFAAGGSPPVGSPSIVGENGPELFIPNQAGTIIPNGAVGGQSVVQTLVFNMQPGLPETVGAAIQSAAPYIAARAHASVFAAMKRGGPESIISGLRAG